MVILGLGSNVGDRKATFVAAINALCDVMGNIRLSSIHETPALLPDNAPAEWDIPFLNMAVCGTCQLSPHELFVRIKAIELQLGRKDRGRWGPREIDIDILAIDDVVVSTPELTIPHKELLNRTFALHPLAELAPDWRWPVQDANFGKTAKELAGL